MTTKNTLW